MPKKFVGEPFTLSLASGTKIIYASEGYVTIIRRKFLSHSTETIPRGTLLCSVSEKKWWRKSLRERIGERGVSRVSVENFLSQIAETIPRATLSLVSGIENVYASEGYVTIFRGTSLTQNTEPFRGGTLLCCVSDPFWLRKSLWKKRGGGLSKLSVANFLSHSSETLVEEPFSAVFQKIAGSEKVYGKERGGGSIEFFRRKIFVSNCRNILTFCRGTLYSFISFGYRNYLCFRGLYHNFPRNFFVSEYRTIS